MNTFSLSIDRFVAKTQANSDTVLRKVAADVFKEVVLRSPVDTGAFQNAWVASTLDLSSKPKPGPPFDKTGANAISAAEAVIRGTRIGQTITISNDLPYGPRLENGWSKQTPQGFVRITVVRWRDFLDNAVAEVQS